MKKLICLLMLIVACGGGSDSNNNPQLIAEQTDYYDGVTYHRYYRYAGLRLGYATSTDGVHFDVYRGNPIMEDAAYPVLVEDSGSIYLIVRKHSTGEYRLYDASIPTRPAFIRTFLRGDYCNMAVSVVDGVWHVLIEGHSEDYFFLMHSIMEDGEFRNFRIIAGDAGNPTMSYIPERHAILALYGADYNATGTWRIKAATYDFTAWTERGVILSEPGHHLADPDIGIGQSMPLIITAGYNQDSINTYYFNGSIVDLYDAIVAGNAEINAEPTNPTMTAE